MNKNEISYLINLKIIKKVIKKIMLEYKDDELINNKLNEKIINSEDINEILLINDEIVGGETLKIENSDLFLFNPDFRYYEGNYNDNNLN